jgi:hypothetical protein
MPDTKRIEREIRLCKNDQDTSVTVEPIDDDLCHLHGKKELGNDVRMGGILLQMMRRKL